MSYSSYAVKIRFRLVLSLILAFLFATGEALTEQSEYPDLNLDIIDYSVAPGDDFYSFASGLWLADTKVPDGYLSYNFFFMRDEAIERDLIAIMNGSVQASTGTHLAEVVCNLYTSCMDTTVIEETNISAIREILGRITSIRNRDELPKVLAQLHLIGLDPFFCLYEPEPWELYETYYPYIRQSRLGLPEIESYVSQSEQAFDLRRRYERFISEILLRMGRSPEAAQSDAEMIVHVETRLASVSMSEPELRDVRKTHNLFGLDRLKKLTEGFNWEEYFTILGLDKAQQIIVGQLEYMSQVGKIIAESDLDALKTYLTWILVYRSCPYLSSDYSRSFFEFKKDVAGWKTGIPRDIFACRVANREAPDALGALYLGVYFPESVRESVQEMIGWLVRAFEIRLKENKWMSNSSKEEAIEKLHSITWNIGGPDHPPEYAGLEIFPDSLVKNIFTVREFRMRRYLKRLGQQIDRKGWFQHPQSTNAWYCATGNVLTLPAGGINQLYNPAADAAWNFGTFGARVGHEMTHGFDELGRKYDRNGAYKSWWSRFKASLKSDNRKLKQRLERLEQFCNSYVVPGDQQIDGKRTLNENVADLSGLNIALDAYLLSQGESVHDTSGGFTGVQRFFLAYAQEWREVFTEECWSIRLSGYHAPPQYRTNGVLFNVPLFYEAFSIGKGDRLYVEPENRIRIW